VRLGIDLGGTKTEILALGDHDETLLRRRVPTPTDSAEAIVAAIARLVVDVERELGRRGTVGVATPGSLSPTTGLLRNSNTVCCNGRPLEQELAAALARPVRLANDANCFALSEAIDGAAVDAAVVFGVIVGTGTGGGIVVDRRVLTGAHAIAGEWGHNPLPWPTDGERPGPPCYCGKHGCIETWLSGPALAADHRRTTGADVDAPRIAELAAHGDAAACATLDRHADRFARALATVIDILDPHVVVLGGGLSNLTTLYVELPRRLGRYVFADRVETRIVAPMHGDSSGVRGAARLWPADAETP
jgi:predicted NBD/HSP70 family sugar kinase